MGHVFSKKTKVSKVTEQDKAVLVINMTYMSLYQYNSLIIINIIFYLFQQLKTTRDKIVQYQKRAEKNLEKDRLLAKQLIKDNKKELSK